MNWVPVILGALSFLSGFIGYLRDRQKLDATGEARIAAAMRARADEMQKAVDARARVDVILDTGGVRASELADKWTRD